MSNLNTNYHLQLIIIDHFDDVINQIDIKTETLLQDQSLKQETRDKLNAIRGEQIEKIKEIKEANLNLLENDKETEELEAEDEIALEKLIHFDCVLLEGSNTLNGLVLAITSWFYDQKELKFSK